MNARPVVSNCRWILIPGSLTFCPLSAFGQDWVPPEALVVKAVQRPRKPVGSHVRCLAQHQNVLGLLLKLAGSCQ